jgi:transcription elongation factor Elf1
MPWNYENLWQKAKTYFERGFNEDRNSELFRIWSSLGLELLARTTLANIHSSLLADPQQGDNILHACGYPSGKKTPKSVPIGIVLKRCTVIIPEYTEADFKFCLSIMEKRNSELHSGESPFLEYPTSIWLPKFLKVCKIFTEFQGKSLIDLLGEEDAKAAESNIEAELNNRQSEVKKLIQEHKKKFEDLELEDRLEKLKESKKEFVFHGLKEKHKCPSCGASAVVEGEAVRYLEAKVEEDGIVEPIICLPTKFTCYCCGLSLSNHIDVYAAGFGDQFTVDQWNDPKDYYEIEFDPSDYYDDEILKI